MSRTKWFSYLLNDEGQPIEDVSISIYEAGSTTDVTVYTHESNDSIDDIKEDSPQLLTNEDGYFEFWIGDINETYGYQSDQKFKIGFEKSDTIDGYNDYISIFPNYIAVDENDTDTIKDKTVSNNIAKGWEDHRLSSSHIIHGITEIDVTDIDTTKDKTVSNSLGKGWEEHKDDTSHEIHGITEIDETDTDATKDRTVSNVLAKGWEDHKDNTSPLTVHGLNAVDETSTNATKDKIINNNLAKGWEDHKDNTSPLTVHGLGTADHTDNNATVNKIVSNNQLLTLNTYTEAAPSGDLVSSGDYYYINIEHSLNDQYPIVVVFDTTTDKKIAPKDILSIDVNNLEVWFNSQSNYKIKINK